MMETCPRCGRPAWQSTGGMGGGIMPDAETHCLKRDGIYCRIAACGRAAGMREAREIAEAWVSSTHNADDWDSETTYDWSDVDREIARRLGNV